MSGTHLIIVGTVLVPLAAIIAYHDIRYRRIPNALVLATLISGLLTNIQMGGRQGLFNSLTGCALAFGLMFLQYCFGALGAGDVKLFAAIGSLIGVQMVMQTFFIILLTGGVVATISMLRAGVVRQTMVNVWMILHSVLLGWKTNHRSALVESKVTVPYGVAITLGSLISIAGAFVRAGDR